MDIGQSVTASLMSVSQTFMIDSEQMQNRSLKIMDMHTILGNVVTMIVRFSVTESWFDSTTSHPDGITTGMMIASKLVSSQPPLTIICPSKFARPDNQCVLKHSALFQIFDQCCGSLICFSTLVAESSWQAAMLIPTRMIKLNEPNTTFSKTSGQQTIGSVGSRFIDIRTIKCEGFF